MNEVCLHLYKFVTDVIITSAFFARRSHNYVVTTKHIFSTHQTLFVFFFVCVLLLGLLLLLLLFLKYCESLKTETIFAILMDNRQSKL